MRNVIPWLHQYDLWGLQSFHILHKHSTGLKKKQNKTPHKTLKVTSVKSVQNVSHF